MFGFFGIEIPLCEWKTIHKFSDIEIEEGKTLVLCDIDDTLLHHPFLNPCWTKLITECFTEKLRLETRRRSRTAGAAIANEYIVSSIQDIPIKHTDESGFFDLVKKIDALEFITARTPYSSEFTKSNLQSIGVDPNLYKIHFAGNIPKGEYIQDRIDLSSYDSVLFIDDLNHNLENVFSYVFHPGLKLYKFNHPKPDPDEYYPFPFGFKGPYRFNGQCFVAK